MKAIYQLEIVDKDKLTFSVFLHCLKVESILCMSSSWDWHIILYNTDDDKEEDNNSCDEEECVIDVPTCSEECVIDSSGLELMSSTSAPTMDMRKKLLIAMMSLAPNSIYHADKAKRRRKKRLMKMVHPLLRSIWTNCASIVSPVTPTNCVSYNSIYPSVDWKVVNKRFLSNVPTPTFYLCMAVLQIQMITRMSTCPVTMEE